MFRKLLFRKKSILLIFSLIIILSLVACNDQSEPTITDDVVEEEVEEVVVDPLEKQLEGEQFEALIEVADDYLQNDYQEVITPREVYENVVLYPDPDYYVVDIRGADDFTDASIIGSVNIPYETISEEHQIDKLPQDKKIIVVCYSGHTASQTAAFWGMLGFDTVAMENGFGGWGGSLDCDPADYELATEPTEATEEFELPEIDYEVDTLKELIIAQGQQIIEDSLRPVIGYSDVKSIVKEESDDYFLVDLRTSKLYQKGFIEGAINIPLKTITDPENLAKLPTDKEIVLISSHGYEASQAARILNVLGYEAMASTFGMSAWTSNEEVIGDQPVVCREVVDYPTVITRIDVEEGDGG
ncbi:rhodanese-like domain-containing protein [Natroniella sulfidigena]|uniref:rhodanese-like domain-containing protein n=1 Tax=Natroniella sulfidigena TaxID=723921 RepID=UPI00200B9FE0|nr:rhodanese-like domain-containing protein [Natroniella sulfidigena]MCK8817021.1 rhodanese-like domain-containing protein [Natroniella sulfidigena]